MSWPAVMKNKVPLIIIVLSLLVIGGCSGEKAQNKVLRSMAEFDQAYIPSLIFANLLKQRESELALDRLKGEWSGFKGKYYNLELKYGLNITDKFWKEDFDRIGSMVVSAEGYVKEKNLPAAYASLAGIRQVMLEIRHRNGLAYFLDGMVEFHDAIERLTTFLRSKRKLSDRDKNNLRELFKEAQTSWSKVAGADIAPSLFGFNSRKVKAIKKKIQNEEKLLAALAAALSGKDIDRMLQAARDLRPNFIELYKAFGEFDPVFKKVIEEKRKNAPRRTTTTTLAAKKKKARKLFR
ncbi:MAG: hypothetical protein PHH60_06165 [Candidatus Margulisbacteria bacterium]|nr:hypothetical protein [Candidatus Margulisiibacteriota bacterium]